MEMMATADWIERKIQQDPGQRGLKSWGVVGELLPATASLARGNHILLTTGFFILEAGAIETDGPPGTVVLGEALCRAGKRVTIIADDHAEKILRNTMKVLDTDMQLVTVPTDRPIDPAPLFTRQTTHFVALERPGQARDGRCYTFRGLDISDHVAPTDDLLRHARKNGIATIGIGDGGNELGMSGVSAAVERYVATDRPFACTTAADFCICAGVSNWAGYGMAALLSCHEGRNLLPKPDQLQQMIAACVDAGAVDGVSGKPEATVDGLTTTWENGIYEELYRLACSSDREKLEILMLSN